MQKGNEKETPFECLIVVILHFFLARNCAPHWIDCISFITVDLTIVFHFVYHSLWKFFRLEFRMTCEKKYKCIKRKKKRNSIEKKKKWGLAWSETKEECNHFDYTEKEFESQWAKSTSILCFKGFEMTWSDKQEKTTTKNCKENVNWTTHAYNVTNRRYVHGSNIKCKKNSKS